MAAEIDGPDGPAKKVRGITSVIGEDHGDHDEDHDGHDDSAIMHADSLLWGGPVVTGSDGLTEVALLGGKRSGTRYDRCVGDQQERTDRRGEELEAGRALEHSGQGAGAGAGCELPG